MKRCPHCEFIYEDDQSLCDLDGFELVNDSLALVPVAPTPRRKSRRIAWAILPIAFIALFLLGFFFKPNSSPSVPQPSAATTAPEIRDASIDQGNKRGAASTPSNATSDEDVPRKAVPTRPAPVTNSRQPSNSKPGRPIAQKAPAKNDSKVGSILKKTGRLLKKPFKR